MKAERQKEEQSGKKSPHARSFSVFARSRKLRPGCRRGSLLVECTLTLSILTIFGLLLLKMALNITTPRQWTLFQTLTDSYMTYEKAFAQRQSFAQITGSASPWPKAPAFATTTVEVGKMPGGRSVTGTVMRTRFADTNNYPDKGGSLTAAQAALANPAQVEVWKLQSVLTYQVNGKTYRKVRTVVRSQ